ncbi:hypothetical protein MKEN_00925300 [Mycena kentingensis (nom. inval.)]|nr:hypothetical protein MKEN_00925300 [Mycena kentingensis (nom. inval.)]
MAADANPALDAFIASFGVELASSWVNMMLYMLEIVLCMRYLQRPGRPRSHRIGVALMLLFDTICTGAVNANVFVTFLSFFGKAGLNFLAISSPTTLSILMTYSTAAVEQLFLCQLYFVMSRNRIISLLLVFIGVVHLGVSYAAGVMVVTTTIFKAVTFQVTAAGAIMCAINDLLIAAFLGYEFYKVQKRNSTLRTVWRRVFFLSLVSGAIVAFTTALMMILLLKGDIAFQFFFSCQGRVYALTLLVNFLSGPFSGSGSTMGSSMNNNNSAHLLGNNTHAPNSGIFRVDAYSVVQPKSILITVEEKSGPLPSLRTVRTNSSDLSLEKDLPALPEIETYTRESLPSSRRVQFPAPASLRQISSPSIGHRPRSRLPPLAFLDTSPSSGPFPVTSIRSTTSGGPHSPESAHSNSRPRTIIYPSQRVDSLPGTPIHSSNR